VLDMCRHCGRTFRAPPHQAMHRSFICRNHIPRSILQCTASSGMAQDVAACTALSCENDSNQPTPPCCLVYSRDRAVYSETFLPPRDWIRANASTRHGGVHLPDGPALRTHFTADSPQPRVSFYCDFYGAVVSSLSACSPSPRERVAQPLSALPTPAPSSCSSSPGPCVSCGEYLSLPLLSGSRGSRTCTHRWHGRHQRRGQPGTVFFLLS
jgi:hypothetical protein